jgi:hypothetical protein
LLLLFPRVAHLCGLCKGGLFLFRSFFSSCSAALYSGDGPDSSVGRRVPLDKDEGVVKAQFSQAVFLRVIDARPGWKTEAVHLSRGKTEGQTERFLNPAPHYSQFRFGTPLCPMI